MSVGAPYELLATPEICPDRADRSNKIQIQCCAEDAHPAPVSRFGTIRPSPNVTWLIVRLSASAPPLTAFQPRRFNCKRAGGNAMSYDTDVIVVGAGLAGLVAATEIADSGKRVILLDQEGEQNLGGQAFWSFGGLFLVNSPEQRRLRIKDSFELALQDWYGAAGFDRDGRSLAEALGGSLCRLCRRRKTQLAARDGPPDFPGGRLGRARRLRRDGPRQLGAALSCQLGNRPRRRRTVRAARARSRGARTAHLQVPPPRRCA